MWHLKASHSNETVLRPEALPRSLQILYLCRKREVKQRQTTRTDPHHSLPYTEGNRILTHTHSGRIKDDHLTWSSTLWATIVAASSCSASLSGRILKATCNTHTQSLVILEFKPHTHTQVFNSLKLQAGNWWEEMTPRAHRSTLLEH